jgi:hypothetical protein
MISVYEELSAKIARAAARGPRDGARRDLGLILFAERERLGELWKAAARCVPNPEAAAEDPALAALREAVEALRPLFGERP